MHWGSVSEFFAMGGYGLYVWGSYGVTALVLFMEVVLVRRRARTPTGIAGHTGDYPTGTEK
ncbi:MAG: heme exporter protein CcmD [Betaproteobacteria bacterium]|nr:MAG: heme exporter protein CcmD [Betaproteobacteria bacterium]